MSAAAFLCSLGKVPPHDIYPRPSNLCLIEPNHQFNPNGGKKMNYWKKDRNYRKYPNEDGSIRHVITVDGEDVEVSAEVFKAYSQADRRERYCYEREQGMLLSLDRMSESNISLAYSDALQVEPAEDTFMRHMLITAAKDALLGLTPNEQRLIQAVVMEGMPERKYAARIGKSQKCVNKRKRKALEKIRGSLLVLKTME